MDELTVPGWILPRKNLLWTQSSILIFILILNLILRAAITIPEEILPRKNPSGHGGRMQSSILILRDASTIPGRNFFQEKPAVDAELHPHLHPHPPGCFSHSQQDFFFSREDANPHPRSRFFFYFLRLIGALPESSKSRPNPGIAANSTIPSLRAAGMIVLFPFPP